jgi:hypothetical protein
MGVRVLDTCLENKFAKMVTSPFLDLTEKSINYFIPIEGTNGDLIKPGPMDNPTTLKRLFDINSRVYKHVYATTFSQIQKLHIQFEETIKKLQTLKQFMDVAAAKQKISDTLDSAKQNTLVARCAHIIDNQKLSLVKLEASAKTYVNGILADVNQLINKYMSLVKNFPISINGTKLTQITDNLMQQLNKESMSANLNTIIAQLKGIQTSLLSYTNQMVEVIGNSKIAQLLKRTPSQSSPSSQSEAAPATSKPSATSPELPSSKQPTPASDRELAAIITSLINTSNPTDSKQNQQQQQHQHIQNVSVDEDETEESSSEDDDDDEPEEAEDSFNNRSSLNDSADTTFSS